MSALTPIAHAGDWFVAAPAVLIVIWLGLTTIRDRRAAGGKQHEDGEHEENDRADPD